MKQAILEANYEYLACRPMKHKTWLLTWHEYLKVLIGKTDNIQIMLLTN